MKFPGSRGPAVEPRGDVPRDDGITHWITVSTDNLALHFDIYFFHQKANKANFKNALDNKNNTDNKHEDSA